MLKNYIKIAWRNIVRDKGYSFLNIGGLAIAMAVLFVVMLYVRYELSYDEHLRNSDRIYRVLIKGQTGEVQYPSTPVPIPYELKELYPEVVRSIKVQPFISDHKYLIATEDKQLYQNGVIEATEDFFYFFDYKFIYGNPDESLKKPDGVVITEDISRKLFADGNPLGKTIEFGGVAGRGTGVVKTVTGVVENPAANTHMNFSMVLTRQKWDRTTWLYPNGVSYIMLDSSNSVENFRDKLPAYFKLYAQYPDDTVIGERGLVLQPVTDAHLYPLGNAQPSVKMVYIRIFLGAALLILLIASINYINLVTARSLKRTAEIGVRKTIGATRLQLIFQILLESVLICSVAFGLSIMIAEMSLPFIDQYFGMSLNTLSWLTPEWVLVILGILLIQSFLSGGYCAFIISKFNPVEIFQGGRSKVGYHSSSFRRALMVGQFAISLILIIATVLMYQQMDHIRSTRMDGVDSQIMVIETQQNEVIRNRFNLFRQELLKESAILDAAAGEPIGSFSLRMTVEDSSKQRSDLHVIFGTFGYLETLNRRIVSGRSLSTDYASDSTTNYVINQTAARYFGIDEARGQEINKPVKGNVVGIFEDYHHYSMYQPIEPVIFGVKFRPDVMENIFIRFRKGAISQGVTQVQNVWNSFDTGIPMDYYFLDQELDKAYKDELQAVRIFGGFSIFSIIIACLGLFGLAAYSASARAKEIGIRKILGASITNIVTLLGKDFIKLVLLGFVIAVPISWYFMNWWLADYAYRIEIRIGIFLLAGGATTLIALASVSWQTIRAALANPADSLRSE